MEDTQTGANRIVRGITTGSLSGFLEARGVYVALVVVILISAILSPSFFKFFNILNVLRAAAVLGIVSIGQTLVILGGGIDLSVGSQMIVVITALLASIGAASVPMSGLVMMSIILKAVGLPLEGVAIILAVDRILDMFRTTVNVLSDSVGAVVVARLEGEELK